MELEFTKKQENMILKLKMSDSFWRDFSEFRSREIKENEEFEQFLKENNINL